MAINRGKQFEGKFKEDFKKAFPDSFLLRLTDQMSGYKIVSQNPCDFIAYVYPTLFLIECKSHEGNTFSWTALSQYDKLVCNVGIKGVRVGVILWMIDHDIVVYLPISTITKMKEDGKKSFNIKMLNDDTYKVYIIPSQKKRVFLDSDYSILSSLGENE